ncbi:PAS domain S-box protein [Algoriphagus confluentis]|uniref:histidine kinase n=1 Tax=Algoriphagus confluentis TaxID=1697556 RepID=A0ABQ6PPJ4_9BACT|nr:hypothetical protein Aconfl_22390 [Algoriphagus confluentis]
MKVPTQIANLYFEQSKDLIWMIDPELKLIYANQAYLELMQKVTGKEKKLNESVLIEGFGSGYVEKWAAYYHKALSGAQFELEEHFLHPESQEISYNQVVFNPVLEENGQVVSVACLSRDISRIVKQRSEAHQLMDSSLDVFCTIDSSGRFVFVSEAARSHWGYAPEELVGTPYVHLILEEDISKTEEIAEAILKGKEIKSFSNRYKKKNGELAYNFWSARWDTQSRMMYCVARDGKEKIEQEHLLQLSEQRFRDLVQEGSDLIAILSEEGEYLYVSPTSLTVLGIHPDEFLGRSAFEFIHPDDVERTMERLVQIGTSKKVQVEPFRFKTKNQEWRWIETVLTNMMDNPAVRGIVANSRDISEKVEEQRQLHLFKKAINSTTDAIIMTEGEPLDEPGPKIIYVNQAFTKVTGYTSEEILGKNPRILQGPDSNPEQIKEMGEKLRNWESTEVTMVNYTKEGKPFWVNFAISPVGTEKGKPSHWISVQRDVTEQKIKDRERELLAEISLNFHNEVDFGMACKNLCNTIGSFGNFDWVELWTVNLDRSKILYLSHFFQSADDEVFYQISNENPQFALGKGLPGKVWESKGQLLWDAVVVKNDFIRKEAAEKINLQTVLGIPLINKGEVIGALLIGTKENHGKLEQYKTLFSHFHNFIGSEINRKQLENNLTHLYESVPDMICILDFQGKFLWVNKESAELLEYPEEEILYHSFEDFVLPSEREESSRIFSSLEKGRDSLAFQNRFLTKSKEIRWLSWTAKANMQEGLIYATARNMTTEKKLQELNRITSQMASIGSWEVDLLKEKIFWSEMVHQLHETDPETFKPKLTGSIDFYREDFRAMVADSVNLCIEKGEPFDFEAVLVSAKKNERWVRAIGSAEFIEGECVRIFGSFQDIHERKQAELRLQSLADNLPGVVFQYYVFPDGTDALRNVSKGAHKVWGYRPQEVMEDIQLVWNQTKAGGEYEEVQKSISDSLNQKTTWICRYKSISPSGEMKTLLGTGTPSFLTDGTVVYNSVVLDITQEAKNEDMLTQATLLAKIGSWEMNLLNPKGEELMYWSPMTYHIFQLDLSFIPTFSRAINLCVGESRRRIQEKMNLLIVKGIPFDEEVLTCNPDGKQKWVRVIGECEKIRDKPVRVFGSFQDIHNSKSLELQIREILGSISDAFYALDAEWRFTYFNKEAERLLNQKESRVLGQIIWELFPAAKATQLETVYQEVVATGQSQSFEYFFPGDECWYEVNAYPSKGGVSVYFKNIDERKQAAEQLKKAYEEKKQILESIGDAFFSVNKEWVVTYWNKEAEILLGKKREEILGKNLWEEYPDAVDSEFYQQYQLAVATGNTVTFEANYPKLGKWFEVSAYPYAKSLSVYFKDVTLRKEADLRLLKANERFEKVTEATNDAIWDWDIEAGTYFRSSAIEKFFGKGTLKHMEESEFWMDRFHPEDLKPIQDSINFALADPECNRWEMEYRIQNEDKQLIYVIDRGVIIRNEAGKPVRMVGAMTDITERKKFEQQLVLLNQSLNEQALDLKRSNEELEQFAFVASHDLQEPLRMISSFMDQLQRKYGNQMDEKALMYIGFATDGARRMKQIILDLLEFSRANRPTDELEEVDLNEFLKEYQLLRRKIISETNTSIQADSLPTLKTHKTLMVQIFHNLLDNSIKYKKEGVSPEIRISFESGHSEWQFSVQDNGIGIPHQFHEKIFNIFQRLHNRDQYPGSGIGLSIAKRCIEYLGGRIWLESQPGEGTTFFFTISKNIV